jgi:hypothetical protein
MSLTGVADESVLSFLQTWRGTSYAHRDQRRADRRGRRMLEAGGESASASQPMQAKCGGLVPIRLCMKGIIFGDGAWLQRRRGFVGGSLSS